MLLVPCLKRVLRTTRTLVSSLGSGSKSESDGFVRPVPILSCRSVAEPAHCRQWYGTHSAKEPVEPLNTAQGARDFVYSLHRMERKSLLQELQKFESLAVAQEEMEIKPPSSAQRRYVFLHSAIPFVGFGFLDNAIMIVAGTQIEMSIGVIFGISTMGGSATTPFPSANMDTNISSATDIGQDQVYASDLFTNWNSNYL